MRQGLTSTALLSVRWKLSSSSFSQRSASKALASLNSSGISHSIMTAVATEMTAQMPMRTFVGTYPH